MAYVERTTLKDENNNTIKSVGSTDEKGLKVRSQQIEELLKDILSELRKLNVHMEHMTDLEMIEGDY